MAKKPTIGEGNLRRNNEILRLVDDLQERIDEAHRRYEMYFLGIEKSEPSFYKDDVRRKIRDLENEYIANTGIKYKFQNLKARYNVLRNYWERILKQKEEGTYFRDVYKAKMRDNERAKQDKVRMLMEQGMSHVQAVKFLEDLIKTQGQEAALAGAGKSGGASAPASASRPSSPPAGGNAAGPSGNDGLGLQGDKLDRVFKAFVIARKQTGEGVDGLSPDAVRRSLEKQAPQLRQKYGDKELDFKVVVKEGRAIIRAVPKE
ncbi:MAG: hypothetical protein GMKNLPBB_01722 [Myxococcota bacterium]|nr:hypothetical protein [Myxococcota bacterium]